MIKVTQGKSGSSTENYGKELLTIIELPEEETALVGGGPEVENDGDN